MAKKDLNDYIKRSHITALENFKAELEKYKDSKEHSATGPWTPNASTASRTERKRTTKKTTTNPKHPYAMTDDLTGNTSAYHEDWKDITHEHIEAIQGSEAEHHHTHKEED